METQGPQPSWSADVGKAAWIAGRLAPFGTSVASVVPAGFEAYARVLHPAQEPGPAGRLVRWAEVAAWSGLPLRPSTPFHGVALPAERPGSPPPWRSQGPDQGRLYLPDAEALAGVLRGFTSVPGDCFFCLWAGYDFGGVPFTRRGDPPAAPLPDPVPAAVRRGPLVELPAREHFLYTGPVEAITAPAGIGRGQTANLAWPADHAWCLASEIDLTSSYVAGPAALIERLVADARIEALPASPADPLITVEPLVTSLAGAAAGDLLDTGHALITTCQGRVEAWLERPRLLRPGTLRVHSEQENGARSGSEVPVRSHDDLRQAAMFRLTSAIIGLVEG